MFDEQNLCQLPTEILLCIFTYLPGRDLIKCRRVSRRWNHIIDRLLQNDLLWREHCKEDFKEVYKEARIKSRYGVSWYNIYRSLALWPMLRHAKENRDEFASAESVNEEICNFEVLRNGLIGVQHFFKIVYYNIETLEKAKRKPMSGTFMYYMENDKFIVLLSEYLHLFLIRRVTNSPDEYMNAIFDNVKKFFLTDSKLFVVNLDNDIHVCYLNDGTLSQKFIKHSEESVMCFGYTDKLHILTLERNIYTVIDNNLVLTCKLDDCPNLLHQFYKYNFLETVDWCIVFQWMSILHRQVPTGPLQEIMTVKKYGDILFVGCNWGVLRIYEKPFVDGEFDFYNSIPIKQYNYMEHSDLPVLEMCPIMKVDVMESVEGHTVLVAMPKKIAILNFVHCFKHTTSVAMLPYNGRITHTV